MANIVPFRSLSGAKEGYLRLRSRVRNMAEKSKAQIMGIARTAEIGLAAGAAGAMNGYLNDPAIGPAPVDITVGAGLKLASIVMGGDMADHIGAIGDGFIGAFVYRKAHQMGLEASAEANNVSTLMILTRRYEGLNDDGSRPADADERPGAG